MPRLVQNEECPFCDDYSWGSFRDWNSFSAHVGIHFRGMSEYVLSQFNPRESNLEDHSIRPRPDGPLAFDCKPLKVTVHDCRDQAITLLAVLDTAGHNAIIRSCADTLGIKRYELPQHCKTIETVNGHTSKVTHCVKPRWRYIGKEHKDEKFLIIECLPKEYADVDMVIGKGIISQTRCLEYSGTEPLRLIPGLLIFQNDDQSLCRCPPAGNLGLLTWQHRPLLQRAARSRETDSDQ